MDEDKALSFTPEQIDLLKAPLSRESVKTRSQSGRSLSYIEGWKAIAEANRIFGFDGWDRETVTLTCVSEKEREIGARKEPGWGVTYIAKVRVLVGRTIREGCGTGHGIDRDLGQAHESALKEAETDAMKRALMTFGNPFGLALYDKEQAEVEDAPQTASQRPAQPQTPTVDPAQARTQKAIQWALQSVPRIKVMNKADLDLFTEKFRQQIVDLDALDRKSSIELNKAIADRLEALFA
jgi:DNA recombination protein Rad52